MQTWTGRDEIRRRTAQLPARRSGLPRGWRTGRGRRGRLAAGLGGTAGAGGQEDALVDLHPERIGHRLDTVEAGAGIAPRLVPLDLLLLQPEAARQLLLAQP